MKKLIDWVMWNKREVTCFFAGMVVGPMIWFIADKIAGLIW